MNKICMVKLCMQMLNAILHGKVVRVNIECDIAW